MNHFVYRWAPSDLLGDALNAPGPANMTWTHAIHHACTDRLLQMLLSLLLLLLLLLWLPLLPPLITFALSAFLSNGEIP